MNEERVKDLLRKHGLKVTSQRLLVLGNFSDRERTVELPFGVRKTVLTNYPEIRMEGNTVVIRPYEAVMAEPT